MAVTLRQFSFRTLCSVILVCFLYNLPKAHLETCEYSTLCFSYQIFCSVNSGQFLTWVTREYGQGFICEIPFSSSRSPKSYHHSLVRRKNITCHLWTLYIGTEILLGLFTTLLGKLKHCFTDASMRVEVQAPHLPSLTTSQSGKQNDASHYLSAK